MNKLTIDKQTAVIRALVEGSSIRSTERMTGVHRDTIMRLMIETGTACGETLDKMMRNLRCRRVEVDEVWCYVGKKRCFLVVLRKGPVDSNEKAVRAAIVQEYKL